MALAALCAHVAVLATKHAGAHLLQPRVVCRPYVGPAGRSGDTQHHVGVWFVRDAAGHRAAAVTLPGPAILHVHSRAMNVKVGKTLYLKCCTNCRLCYGGKAVAHLPNAADTASAKCSGVCRSPCCQCHAHVTVGSQAAPQLEAPPSLFALAAKLAQHLICITDLTAVYRGL